MYNLLQQYEVTVPSEHLVLHEDLHDRQAEYRRYVRTPIFNKNRENNLLQITDIEYGGCAMH